MHLAPSSSTTTAGFALPDFAGGAVQRVLAEEPPTSERARVLGHNDLNPTNLVYDGEAIRVLEFYQRMRSGELKLGTADGQGWFGLALLKESLAL